MPDTKPATRQSLADDLMALGVRHGGILFVHSSYKSVGDVEGGAGAIVAAMEDALGPHGLLLMPSFNLVTGGLDARTKSWNLTATPSTVGYLTEYFRRMPGTFRSDHYSHAVAGRGNGHGGASVFLNAHRSLEGYESPWDKSPWGRSYGIHSPMLRAYRANAQVLMLGVDYKSSTYMHVVEVLHWHRRRLVNPSVDYQYINRAAMGEHWDSLSKQRRGRVGQADCRLFDAADFVDTLLGAAIAEPKRFYKWWVE